MDEKYPSFRPQNEHFGRSCFARFVIAALVVSCLACSIFSIWFYNLYAPDEKAGSEKARPIILALQNYKNDNGSFPLALDRLTPSYLSTIPKPDLFNEYFYYLRDDGQSYILAFVPMGEADGHYAYCSKYEEWTRADSGFWGDCPLDLR